MTRHTSASSENTVALGRSFASGLVPGDVVALFGELGSGKTRFVVGICEGLQVTGHVASPTFTLINEYPAPFGVVAHIDLYRIAGRGELPELGVQEYFRDDCICLIEWAERALDLLPERHYRVRFGFGKRDDERIIVVGTEAEVAA